MRWIQDIFSLNYNKLQKHTTTINIFLFIALAILFLLLRWNTFTTPFERDEGEYAYSAWIMRQGEMPYENSFIQKPPLIIYVYLLGQYIGPSAVWPPRLLAAMFIALTTLLLALIAEKEFRKNAGWVTAFIVTPMLVMPQITAFSANTEVFMLLPLISLLYVYVFKRDTEKIKFWFLVGVFAALSVLFKPISIYVIMFILIVWFVKLKKNKVEYSALIKRIIVSFVGVLITSIFVLSPFILHDAGVAFWESVVKFNIYYASYWGYGFANLFRHIGIFWKSYWVLFIFLAYFVFKRPRKWWFYIGLLIAALLAVYQTAIGHYYVLVLPFLTLISAYSIVLLAKEKAVANVIKTNTSFWITTIVVLVMLWPVRSQFGKTPEDFSLWVYGTVNPFRESKDIADKIAERTGPDDYIFVAGSEPEIYYYAKRKSPTRFVITYPLIIDTPKRLDYQKEAIKDLKNNSPSLIVYSQRQRSGLWEEGTPREFVDYLDNLLEESYSLLGGYLWRNDKVFWLDNLTEDELRSASLLLYNKVDK